MDDGQHPPTLDQALDLVRGKPDRHIIMEIKSISSAQEQILLNKLSGLESQVYVNSFASLLSRIQRLKAANPLLNISLATNSPVLPVPAGISGEDPEYTSITSEHVARLHGAGMLAKAWVADNATAWQTLRDIGVDAIMTNNTSAYLQWATTGCSGVPPQPRDQTPPNVSVSGPADSTSVAATVQVTGGRTTTQAWRPSRCSWTVWWSLHRWRARKGLWPTTGTPPPCPTGRTPSSSRLATRLATSVGPTSCRWPCTTWTRRPRRRRPRCPGRGAAQAMWR